MYVTLSSILAAITTFADMEWFGVCVIIFQSLVALYGTVGGICGWHLKKKQAIAAQATMHLANSASEMTSISETNKPPSNSPF